MDESSDKRKERLRAMRMEAFQAETSLNPETNDNSTPSVLFNPLVETSTSQGPSVAPRFDFYTDPMAAYHGNRKHSNVSNQSSQGYSAPGGGNPMVRFPPSPLGPRHPNPMTQPYQPQSHSPPYMEPFQRPYVEPYQRPYIEPYQQGRGPVRSPSAMMGPNPTYQGPPGLYNGNPGASAHHYPSHSPRPSNSPIRGQYFGGRSPNFNPGQRWNPRPNLGRGSGQLVANDRGSGGRRGYQQGNYSSCRYYDKSMVEDPWKNLEPVIWKGSNFRVTSIYGLNKAQEAFQRSSSNSKKPRVVETFNTSGSKESLADYLASAFDEAVEEAGSREEEAV